MSGIKITCSGHKSKMFFSELVVKCVTHSPENVDFSSLSDFVARLHGMIFLVLLDIITCLDARCLYDV